MAIWSLTREKVTKLLQEVGNKELEIDELLKLSPKQLWATDLDGFIMEWRLALEEDQRRASEGTVKKKRGGKLLGKGAKGKKKADADDSDYEAKKKKTAAAKAKVETKKQSTLGFKPAQPEKGEKKPVRAAKKETPMVEELSDDDFEMLEQNAAKARPAAVPKLKEKVPSVELLSSSPAAAEKIGALSKRTEVYNAESDDDDDDDDVFIDAVSSKMPPNKSLKVESEDDLENSEVEKLKSKKAPLKKATVTAKAPVKVRAAAKPAAKPKAMLKIYDTDDDEPPPPRAATNKPKRAAAARKPTTDMETESDDDGLGDVSAMVKGVGDADASSIQLFKESPAKAKASKTFVAKKAAKPTSMKAPINVDSDDDDNEVAKKSENMLPSDSEGELVPLKVPVKPTGKKVAPTRAAPVKKAAPSRKIPAKPIAKPAAKSRGKKPVEESEDELDVELMADKLLDSDDDVDMEEVRPVSRGRAARGAAAKVSSYKIAPADSEDDDDDDDDDEGSDDFGDDSE